MTGATGFFTVSVTAGGGAKVRVYSPTDTTFGATLALR